MSGPDNGLRAIFHDKLRKGCHWQAIETGGTGRGIPDSNVCIEHNGVGVEVWVEMKAAEAWAVKFQPEQVSWHKTRIRRGGRTFIAVRRQHDGGPRKGDAVDELWLCHGRWAETLEQEGLRCEEIVWEGVWSGGPSRWDWAAVRAALLGAGRG